MDMQRVWINGRLTVHLTADGQGPLCGARVTNLRPCTRPTADLARAVGVPTEALDCKPCAKRAAN